MPALKSTLHTASLNEVQLRAIFKKHDVNGDGHLNKQELKEAFWKLGAIMPSWRADRAIYYTDIDIDGVICEEEIDELVAYAVECGYTVDWDFYVLVTSGLSMHNKARIVYVIYDLNILYIHWSRTYVFYARIWTCEVAESIRAS